jgi:very-short-patch-repair endonuclease
MSLEQTLRDRMTQEIESWCRQLLDLSKSNRLLFFTHKQRMLQVAHPSTSMLFEGLIIKERTFTVYRPDQPEPETTDEDLADLVEVELIQGVDDVPPRDAEEAEPVSSSSARPSKPNEVVLSSPTGKKVENILYRFRLRACSALQEQGVNVLFLTFGILDWTESPTSTEHIQSPLFLLPVRLERQTALHPFTLAALDEGLILNPALEFKLKRDFNLTLSLPDAPEDESLTLDMALDAIRVQVAQRKDWQVIDQAHLGIFSFAKYAMYADLDSNRERFGGHPVLRLLAGDPSALPEFGDDLLRADDLDEKVKPTDTFQVLDADASQQEAIEAVKSGVHLVIQGPPGTGKSQTITNIVAEVLGTGKTVLFVSEKMAALRVVASRLEKSGLRDFILEAHSQSVSREDVIKQLARSLDAPRAGDASAGLMDLQRIGTLRSQLNAYTRTLHDVANGLGRSAFQLHGAIANLKNAPKLHFDVADVAGLTPQGLYRMGEAVRQLQRDGELLLTAKAHPWYGCTIAAHTPQVQGDLESWLHLLTSAGSELASLHAAWRDALALSQDDTLDAARWLQDLAGVLNERHAVPAPWFTLPSLAHLALKAEANAPDYEAYRGARDELLLRYSDHLFDRDLMRLAGVFETGAPSLGSRFSGDSRLPEQAIAELRPQLENAFAQTELALNGFQQTASAAASLVGLPVPTGTVQMRVLQAIALLVLRDHRPLESWFEPGRLQAITNLVEEAKRHHTNIQQIRMSLTKRFDEKLFDLDLARLSGVLESSVPSLAGRFYSTSQTPEQCTADLRPQLARVLPQAERALAAFQDIAAALAALVGLPVPRGAAQARQLRGIVEIVLQDHRPQESWFEPGRLHAVEEFIAETRRQLETVQKARGALTDKFEEDLFDAVTDGLKARFVSDYASWTRVFNGEYRGDMKRLRGLMKSPSALKYPEAREVIETAHRHNKARAWLAGQSDVLARDLGRLYAGPKTNWQALEQAVSAMEQLTVRLDRRDASVELRTLMAQGGDALVPVQQADKQLAQALQDLDKAISDLGNVLSGGDIQTAAEDDVARLQAMVATWAGEAAALWSALDELGQQCRSPEPLQFLEARHAVEMASRHNSGCALLDGQNETLLRNLGHHYTGAKTDWQALEQAIASVEELSTLLGHQVPPGTLTALMAQGGDAFQAVSQMTGHVAAVLQGLETAISVLATLLSGDDLGTLANEDVAKLRELVKGWSEEAQVLWAALDEVKACTHTASTTFAAAKQDVRGALRCHELGKQLQQGFDELSQQFGPQFNGWETRWADVEHALHWVERVRGCFSGGYPEGFIAQLQNNVDVPKDEQERSQRSILAFTGALERLCGCFTEEVLNRDGIGSGATGLRAAVDWGRHKQLNMSKLEEWIDYNRAIEEVSGEGLASFIEALVRETPERSQWLNAFHKRVFLLYLSHLYDSKPELRNFRGARHDEVVSAFKKLDRNQWSIATSRLRHFLNMRRPEVPSVLHPKTEMAILKKEASKRKRFKALRKLFAEIPTLLPALKPCMMMSPLSVAQYLGETALTFDVVVFDEASQILPADAIGAIGRGKQVVIVGDQKQLPPTSFFAAAALESETNEDEETPESILDACLNVGLPSRMLTWHYRSRHEDLIAFSNKYFYDSRLTTFPSPEANARAVEFVQVPGAYYDRGATTVNRGEARHIADLVVQHARTTPSRSLGVITFSEAQMVAIQTEIDQRKREHPELECLLREDGPEGFFVKNLENVQGDERDVIYFSVGYGPDQSGKLTMTFGPLNKSGGERRLNVAVTRAREHVKLLASFHPSQIDRGRTKAKGVHLLRSYMEFADQGPIALLGELTEEGGEPESPFETSVADALMAHGLRVVSQVGVGGFRIDLGIKDEERDIYLLGVECDGATYHSSKTARDRDRLRQEVLENLGWRIHRIWSTDWLKDPEREIKKVLASLDEARVAMDQRLAEAELAKTIPFVPPQPSPDPFEEQDPPFGAAGPAETPLSNVQVAAVAAVLGLAKPYIRAELPLESSAVDAFEFSPMTKLAALLEQIVAVEAPIHEDRAFQGVAALFSKARVGKNIRQRLERALANAVSNGSIHKRGAFLWRSPLEPATLRTVEPFRTIQEVAPEEIAAGVIAYLERMFSMSRGDLVVAMAREMGFNRTGTKVQSAIQEAIDLLIAEGRLALMGEQLSLKS